MNEIAELIEEIRQAEIDGENVSKVVILGNISTETLETIKILSNLDLSDFNISIDSFSIRHILQGHGNKKRENNRGQEVVTEHDFGIISEIINNPDKILFDGQNKQRNHSFQFQSEKGNKYFVFTEVRTGRKQLALKTMRIYLTKKENQNVNSDSLY
jgi:phage-Barnase-EndoU-ColicinE5/D-RelE like nuclease3